jgi:ATP-dependent DNA helicase RecG
LYEELVNGVLSNYRVDLLHGRQSAEEKDATLRAFAAGHTQVIVATSVVEVGIDVPNATVMTIESAERFGLSQLHQLRGRVCRSRHMGYVCVFSSAGDAAENERLKAFSEHADGFRLAEIDMQLRGPGNLFSTEQTGFPPLLIADLIRDAELVAQAKQMAAELVAADPELKQPDIERLRRMMIHRYGHALDLSDVG